MRLDDVRFDIACLFAATRAHQWMEFEHKTNFDIELNGRVKKNSTHKNVKICCCRALVDEFESSWCCKIWSTCDHQRHDDDDRSCEQSEQ